MNANNAQTTIGRWQGNYCFYFDGRPYGPAYKTSEDAQKALDRCVAKTGLDPRHADEKRLAALCGG